MPRDIDSDALTSLNRVLGIAGSRLGAQTTELDDGNLTQVLDVNEIVRRSRTLQDFDGIYFGVIRNVHAGAGELITSVDPYALPVGAGPGFPTNITAQTGLELWLIGASLYRISGTGTLDGATLELIFDSPQQAFGVDDSGAAVATTGGIPLAHWDSILTTITSNPGITEQGEVYIPMGIRLARASIGLRFISDVAGAAATMQTNIILGLFPAGLGQDVAT